MCIYVTIITRCLYWVYQFISKSKNSQCVSLEVQNFSVCQTAVSSVNYYMNRLSLWRHFKIDFSSVSIMDFPFASSDLIVLVRLSRFLCNFTSRNSTHFCKKIHFENFQGHDRMLFFNFASTYTCTSTIMLFQNIQKLLEEANRKGLEALAALIRKWQWFCVKKFLRKWQHRICY